MDQVVLVILRPEWQPTRRIDGPAMFAKIGSALWISRDMVASSWSVAIDYRYRRACRQLGDTGMSPRSIQASEE